MISKVANIADVEINRQVEEIVNQQFANNRVVRVFFPAADKEVKVSVGFKVNRFLVVDCANEISVWRTSSDSMFTYLRASAAGTVDIMFWRS